VSIQEWRSFDAPRLKGQFTDTTLGLGAACAITLALDRCRPSPRSGEHALPDDFGAPDARRLDAGPPRPQGTAARSCGPGRTREDVRAGSCEHRRRGHAEIAPSATRDDRRGARCGSRRRHSRLAHELQRPEVRARAARSGGTERLAKKRGARAAARRYRHERPASWSHDRHRHARTRRMRCLAYPRARQRTVDPNRLIEQLRGRPPPGTRARARFSACRAGCVQSDDRRGARVDPQRRRHLPLSATSSGSCRGRSVRACRAIGQHRQPRRKTWIVEARADDAWRCARRPHEVDGSRRPLVVTDSSARSRTAPGGYSANAGRPRLRIDGPRRAGGARTREPDATDRVSPHSAGHRGTCTRRRRDGRGRRSIRPSGMLEHPW